jgi:hypothetical protein
MVEVAIIYATDQGDTDQGDGIMKSNNILRRATSSPLVKRVQKLVRKTCTEHQPSSDEVVSVNVRIRQTNAGFTYTDRLGQKQTQNHTKTVGRNLDCYI